MSIYSSFTCQKISNNTVVSPAFKALDNPIICFTQLESTVIRILPTDKNLGPALLSMDWVQAETLKHLHDELSYRKSHTTGLV